MNGQVHGDEESFEHRIEEEEQEMFPRAKRVFDAEELDQLGARMTARREALTAASAEGWR